MTRNYDALRRHLAELAEGPADALRLPFARLDDLVGGLPPSARKHRAWWSNNGYQSRAWREAGWVVAAVWPAAGEVLFQRAGYASTSQAGASADGAQFPAAQRNARAPGSVGAAVVGVTDVRLVLEWRDAGDISLDADGSVRFPRLPALPGLYRMTFLFGEGARPRIYIGETDGLRRRFNHYRRPGPSQTTNVRLNKALKDHLGKALTANLAVAPLATIAIGTSGPAQQLDLTRKAARLLAESAALVAAQLAAEAEIENLE